jgi:hypothetical protein
VGLSTTNLAQSISVMQAMQLVTASNYAEFTAATNATAQLYGAMGVYNATSAGLPASVSIASINQTGANLNAANVALVFRNN